MRRLLRDYHETAFILAIALTFSVVLLLDKFVWRGFIWIFSGAIVCSVLWSSIRLDRRRRARDEDEEGTR